MDSSRRRFQIGVAAAATALTFPLISRQAVAATAEDLNKDAAQALATLYKGRPVAQEIAKKARAVLVFPKVVRAGLVFGGSYGEGVLMKGDQVAGYYNSVSASWGWQAGAESYAYFLFLLSDKAIRYLETSKGWEIGVGPRIVVVNEGAGMNFSSTTLKDDAYAFINDQQGLMASLSIEGTKISRIKR
ncbi:MAG TPA: lipid-binding SYLF domain-containing protein [Burkholderiaceae bacterium]|jgi:lipid-binding SYLF domain-containing protein|nr:lipid-binding SYLF domain-containing protein [Burkholderiaceae bacterium]